MNINEAVTPEQKEAGQREMNKIYIDPINKLEEYYNKKWQHKTTTKDYIKAKEEKERLYQIKREMEQLSKQTKKNVAAYYKEIMGTDPKVKYKESNKENSNYMYIDKKDKPTIKLNTNEKIELDDDGEYAIAGLTFKKLPDGLEKIIKKFIINHENGHLYDYLKEYMEKGKTTFLDSYTGNYKRVADSEGVANAYAIDNMYRKDRRELIKNSDLDKTYSNKDLKKYMENRKGEERDYKDFDKIMKVGTRRHSKKLRKVLKSIEKEKTHFEY